MRLNANTFNEVGRFSLHCWLSLKWRKQRNSWNLLLDGSHQSKACLVVPVVLRGWEGQHTRQQYWQEVFHLLRASLDHTQVLSRVQIGLMRGGQILNQEPEILQCLRASRFSFCFSLGLRVTLGQLHPVAPSGKLFLGWFSFRCSCDGPAVWKICLLRPLPHPQIQKKRPQTLLPLWADYQDSQFSHHHHSDQHQSLEDFLEQVPKA